MQSKQTLRQRLRDERRRYVAELPGATRALILRRPPSQLLDLVPAHAIIGLYAATAFEAPANGYARWFLEAGHRLALPAFSAAGSDMEFRAWSDPFADSDLEPGPYEILQPNDEAPLLTPDIVFLPLVGFDSSGRRLGQGGGHYDRWLAAHPSIPAIGLAWDCQHVAEIPEESHDRPLRAVVTPTQIFGPF